MRYRQFGLDRVFVLIFVTCIAAAAYWEFPRYRRNQERSRIRSAIEGIELGMCAREIQQRSGFKAFGVACRDTGERQGTMRGTMQFSRRFDSYIINLKLDRASNAYWDSMRTIAIDVYRIPHAQRNPVDGWLKEVLKENNPWEMSAMIADPKFSRQLKAELLMSLPAGDAKSAKD